MTKQISYLPLSLLFLFMWILGCTEDDPETTERDDFIQRIEGTWVMDENGLVTIDNQDITDLFLGFELTVESDLGYTTNIDDLSLEEFPWSAFGSLELNDDLTELTREDGLVISIDINSDEDRLTLEFVMDDMTDGRIAGVIGSWKLVLVKSIE